VTNQPGKGSEPTVNSGVSAVPDNQQAPPAVSAKLQQTLQVTNDWRAFALMAEQRPSEGGHFYALHFAELCARKLDTLKTLSSADIAKRISSTGSVSPQQLAAAETFFAKCASFAEGEALQMYERLKLASKKTEDPLIAASEQLISAAGRGRGEFAQLAIQLLETQDPLALTIRSPLERIAAQYKDGKGTGAYYFDGKMYQANTSEVGELIVAFQLAGCSFGAWCELDDQMMLACVLSGTCFADRESYMKSMYVGAGGGAASFERARALSSRVALAIRNKQIEAFLQSR
jgi:hypothetical protein